jgi:hypothetical protein
VYLQLKTQAVSTDYAEDGGDGQNIYNLLPEKGHIDQFAKALGDPQLWLENLVSDMFDICTFYYTLIHA